MPNALPFQTAKQLAAAVRAKRIGCLELLEVFLDRVETLDPALNAIVVTDVEGARLRARAADEALRNGEVWGPLHGVPMTIKESLDVAGMPTTFGFPELRDNVATTNSLLAQRMIDAGVTLFGKTNVPLNLADWQSYNEVYGSTNNPWDLTRTPGGSSGGSAAALAAGLTGIDAGSDIGSSIRNPAHYCGVYGHKPTFGIVSPKGHGLPGHAVPDDIGVVGPLARGAGDLEIAMRAIVGADELDGRGWTVTLPRATQRRLADFTVGLLLDDPNAPVDRSVQDQLQSLADFLGRQGARIDDRTRPAIDTNELNDVYVQLLRGATSGRLSDAQHAAATEAARHLDPADISYPSQAVRGNALSHRAWLALDERRHEMRLAWDAYFGEVDVLLCPPAMTAAFAHDQAGDRNERTIEVDGQPVLVTKQIFWAGYTGLTGLPSTVAPIGFDGEGMPIGVQIAGPQYGDHTCIQLAKLLEREYHSFVVPPAYR